MSNYSNLVDENELGCRLEVPTR